MSTPMDWQPSKAIQAKTGASKKNYSPVDRKPERAIQAKMGWWKKMKGKNERKTNMQKHWPQMRCLKHLRDCSNRQQYHSNFYKLPAFSDGLDVSSNDGIPRRGTFAKCMSECEPLRAQYSNVLSVSAKLCLQIANHHAFQIMHTCIIMHLTCSCVW